MKSAILLTIRAYQLLVSPLLGQNCRFYPSCSNYALEAVHTHGSLTGCWLAARRLCKCHPWHVGGVDPVPPIEKNSMISPASNNASTCDGEKKCSDPILHAGHSSNLS